MGDVTKTPLYDFTEQEIAQVRRKYPGLSLARPGVWKGVLDFHATYNDVAISESYQVAILVPEDFPAKFPAIAETGGRIQSIARKYNITDLRGLHCNPNNLFLCLCVKQEEKTRLPAESKFIDYIDELVVPYFYGLTFFDQHGAWPWGEWSHGVLGVLEHYSENSAEQSVKSILELGPTIKSDEEWKYYTFQIRKPSAKKLCVCGSKKAISGCHKKAWHGIILLSADVKKFNLNVEKIFSRWQ